MSADKRQCEAICLARLAVKLVWHEPRACAFCRVPGSGQVMRHA